MTKVISRLYPTCERAQEAVRSLEAAGVPHSDISIVANNSDNWYSNSKDGKVDREGRRNGHHGRLTRRRAYTIVLLTTFSLLPLES